MRLSFLPLVGLLASLMLACSAGPADADVIQLARDFARLAPVPGAARDVRAQTVGNTFSRTAYLRFQASADAVEQFLASSPGLHGLRPEPTCVPDAHARAQAEEAPADTVVLFVQRQGVGCWGEWIQLPRGQRWFDVADVRRARVFRVPQDVDANGGLVIVDDERGVVLVQASHS